MRTTLLPLMTFLCISTFCSYAGKLEITLSYERQEGRGSNQYAVWIEDATGNLVKTLYVTNFTAQGGYEKRPACVPTWVEKSNAPDLSLEEIDTFSGATPQTGTQTYLWNETDTKGNKVLPGIYKFIIEANLLGENRVIYQGEFNTEGDDITLNPSPEYNSEEIEKRGMITNVQVKYTK